MPDTLSLSESILETASSPTSPPPSDADTPTGMLALSDAIIESARTPRPPGRSPTICKKKVMQNLVNKPESINSLVFVVRGLFNPMAVAQLSADMSPEHKSGLEGIWERPKHDDFINLMVLHWLNRDWGLDLKFDHDELAANDPTLDVACGALMAAFQARTPKLSS